MGYLEHLNDIEVSCINHILLVKDLMLNYYNIELVIVLQLWIKLQRNMKLGEILLLQQIYSITLEQKVEHLLENNIKKKKLLGQLGLLVIKPSKITKILDE